MSAIRQQAIEIIERMPEEKIYDIVNLLQKMEDKEETPKQNSPTEAQIAFQKLKKYRKEGAADRDYKAELYTALEEKYERLIRLKNYV